VTVDRGVGIEPEPAGTQSPLRWIRAVAIALVVIGCALRFVGLSSKVVWNDETHTGTVVAGASTEEIRLELLNGRVSTREEILAYQFPRADRSVFDSVAALYWDQPKHPPLYFVLARSWVTIFGPSIGVLRGLSASLSLLCLPLVYVLCRELADDDASPWLAVGLISVSPLHLVYAQEARQYSLWLFFVLLASWCLLRAVRSTRESAGRGWPWFAAYSAALALAAYSHLLSVYVAAAHAVFVLGAERFRFTTVVRRTAVSFVLAALLVSPWAAVVLLKSPDFGDWASWASKPLPIVRWLAKIPYGVSKLFVDMNRVHDGSPFVFSAIAGCALLIAGSCAMRALASAPRRMRWFVLSTAVVYWAPFVISDVFRQSWRATVIRYQFPSLLAVQLSVAFGLSYLLVSPRPRARLLGILAAVALLACGIGSGVAHSRATVWWNKFGADRIQSAVEVINRARQPLVVAILEGRGRGDALALAHAAADHVQFQYLQNVQPSQIAGRGREVFLWDASRKELGVLADLGWSAEAMEVRRFYRLIPTSSAGQITEMTEQ
jgi:uncharacterized membrane protein